jgi:hypothetical protein
MELSKEELKMAEDIIKLKAASQYLSHGKLPTAGQYLITSMSMHDNYIEQIGYCVQVRLKSGAFGSNQYLIRHPNGSLICHENQSFYSMTPGQRGQIRMIGNNEYNPETEIPQDNVYSIDGIAAKGFIISEKEMDALILSYQRCQKINSIE